MRGLDGECSLALIEEDLKQINNLRKMCTLPSSSSSGCVIVEHESSREPKDSTRATISNGSAGSIGFSSNYDDDTVAPSAPSLDHVNIPANVSLGALRAPRSCEPWETRYNELLEFKRIFGHCNVPGKWERNKPLATWVCNQRQRYNGTNSCRPLSKDQIEKLEAIGFHWTRRGKRDRAFGTITVRGRVGVRYSWDERFAHLVQFKEKHGHCNVATHRTPLGRWVATQRQRFKGNVPNRMKQYQINKLESIGFKWSFYQEEEATASGDCSDDLHLDGRKRIVEI